MTIKRVATVLSAVALLGLMGAAPVVRAADKPPKVPHMIMCQIKGAWVVAYLDRVNADGSASYLSVNRRRAAKISMDSVMQGTDMAATSCRGKTLKQLIADGQAFYFRQ